jgi:hypothetical protein
MRARARDRERGTYLFVTDIMTGLAMKSLLTDTLTSFEITFAVIATLLVLCRPEGSRKRVSETDRDRVRERERETERETETERHRERQSRIETEREGGGGEVYREGCY